MKQYSTVIVIVYIILGLFFTACVKKNTDAEDGESSISWITENKPGEILPGVNPLEVTGDITIAGSSTCFPLVEALASRFEQEGYAHNLTISSIGSGAGFERFAVAAETDISMASRPIKQQEIDAAIKNNRFPLEFRIGADALSVTVHPENTWLQSASMEELALLFTKTNWNEVNPSWPDQPILRFIPGTDSGTFDYFVEAVFDKHPEPLLNAKNLQLSEDDNILVRGVAGNKYAIAFFGYAYYVENKEIIKTVDINNVTPNRENIDNNTYPLARPLFLYTAANIMEEKPQVAAFLNYVLTFVNEEIIRIGYFPAEDTELQNAKNFWITHTKEWLKY